MADRMRVSANVFGITLLTLVVMAAMFFVYAAILMAVWNAVIPSIAHSVDTTWNAATDFANISYTTVMLFTILIGMVFGVPVFCSKIAFYYEKSIQREI